MQRALKLIDHRVGVNEGRFRPSRAVRKVRLQLVATDCAVDLIVERIDLALRVRTSLTSGAALTMRSLGLSTRILVASPQLASLMTSIEHLAHWPTLATNDTADDLE